MFTKCIERSELCNVTNSSENSSTPCLLNGNLHSHAANVALVVMIKVGLFHLSPPPSLPIIQLGFSLYVAKMALH